MTQPPVTRWPLRLLAMALCCGLVYASLRNAVHAGSEEDAERAARASYQSRTSAAYSYPFGAGKPFLPSNATTDTGQFLASSAFPDARYCGHCHQAAYTQWRASAHANSFRPAWYQRNVALLRTEKGVEYTRHCEGCHNPIALFSGRLTPGGPTAAAYDNDGVTCSVCHSIQKVTTVGTGSYVMAVPAVLLDENGNPITRPVSDAEVLAHLDRHRKAVMKDFYASSEFCASCHKAALPHSLNGYKWLRAFSVYDEWQGSSFAKQSPLPFYVKPVISTCQTCHMPSQTFNGSDSGAKNGRLASHRWLGGNSLVPQVYNYPEQTAQLVQFLEAGALNVDIFALERSSGQQTTDSHSVIAPLGVAAFTIASGELLTADLVIQNKGIGHSHVPEQRDMYESWVDFSLKDDTGKLIAESGYLKPGGELDPDAHSFTNRLINARGGLNDLHQVWDNRVVAYNNSIQSGRSQLVRYSFRMPPSAGGTVTLTATIRYRRFDQHFLDFGLGKSHAQEPVIDMVSTSRSLHVGNNVPSAPLAGENAEWMRWNNYGIALLDAQQYAGAVAAFQHVVRMRPGYADAYTNMAIVQIQWEHYTDALPNLAESLRLAPGNARALYYRALVERNEGNLTMAIDDLGEVLKSFPQSRDAHRELGFSFYQEHRYPEALAQYQALQGIDPDDLAAHYNLAILYRRLGMHEQARREASAFSEQKDDPTASAYALEYLRMHTEVANESVPWHTHTLRRVPEPVPAMAGTSSSGAGR